MNEESFIKISSTEIKSRIKELPQKIHKVCLENTYKELLEKYEDYKNSLFFKVKRLFNKTDYTFEDYFEYIKKERKDHMFSTYWRCSDSTNYSEIIQTLSLLADNTQGDIFLSSEHLQKLVYAEYKSNKTLSLEIPKVVREYYYKGTPYANTL